MIRVDSNPNEVVVLLDNTDGKGIEKDFSDFFDVLSKSKKLPFCDVCFTLPICFIESFFKFLKDKNLKYKESIQDKKFLMVKF